jgi:membrane fusion protein, heavy metal efflux system
MLFTAALVAVLGWISLAGPGEKAGHDFSPEKPANARSDGPPSVADAGGHGKREEEGHKEDKHVKMGEAERHKFGIQVATAGPGRVSRELNLPGEIVVNTDRMAHIVPRVPGVVREVRKTLGDRVKQGEVMAVIESRELAKAKADYLAAMEKVLLAEAKYVREEALWKKKISAEMDYLDARQALAEAKITLRLEEHKLHALGFSHPYLKQLPQMPDDSFTRFEIVAPFDGTVIEKHITRGEVLKDETEVFLIADLSSVWVNITVYQKDLQSVRKGQEVSISTDQDTNPEGDTARAEIAFVSPLVKEQTRTALARVVLPNPTGQWRPGMFVNVKVSVEMFSVPVMIPGSAIQTLEERSVVFVKEGEGFEARPVEVGRSADGHLEILSGLSSGEEFVVKGGFVLKSELKKETLSDHGH